MRNQLGIGSHSGIFVSADRSGIFILLLVVCAVTGIVFADLHPQWGTALIWSASLVVSALVLASVLVHKLAHALAAMARQVPADILKPSIFHSASIISDAWMSPTAEFKIAMVGPLTSLLLGGIILWIDISHTAEFGQMAGDPTGTLAGLDLASTVLLWTGSVNILLGIFTIVPGFPLDGGRMLRSILWAAMGDPGRATEWASRIGRLIAWGLVAAGISFIVVAPRVWLGLGPSGGLVLVFTGWLLKQAAVQNDLPVAVKDIFGRMRTEGSKGPGVLSVPPNIPVSSLVTDYIIGSDDWACLVMDRGHWVGRICREDVRNVPSARWDTTEVGEIMTSANRLRARKSSD